MPDAREEHSTEGAAFAVDMKNRVVYWSEGATALLGFDEKQLLNRHLEEALTVWDRTGNRCAVGNASLHEMARQGEEIRELSIEIAHRDGNPVRVAASVEVIERHEDGSYQLLFQLRPDRRKQRRDPDLQQMIRQALADFEVSPASDANSKAASPSSPSLSERQVEVLSLLSQGKHCDSIADELKLSVNTVRRHVQNAMERLDAHTQAEAVAKSIRLNLI